MLYFRSITWHNHAVFRGEDGRDPTTLGTTTCRDKGFSERVTWRIEEAHPKTFQPIPALDFAVNICTTLHFFGPEKNSHVFSCPALPCQGWRRTGRNGYFETAGWRTWKAPQRQKRHKQCHKNLASHSDRTGYEKKLKKRCKQPPLSFTDVSCCCLASSYILHHRWISSHQSCVFVVVFLWGNKHEKRLAGPERCLRGGQKTVTSINFLSKDHLGIEWNLHGIYIWG